MPNSGSAGRIDYDTISASYDGHRSMSVELAETISAEAGLLPGARILDIGCGTGNIENSLASILDLATVGLDQSFGMLSAAKKKMPGAWWVQADSNALPLKSGLFDCVLMLYVIHHLPDFRDVIRNIYELLREGTFLILTASHKQIDESFQSRFFPSYAPIDKARFPAIDSIVEGLDEAGFEEIESRTVVVGKITLDERYLEKTRNRHVSTLHLVGEEEFREGLRRMEAYIREHAGEPPLDHKGTLIVGRKGGENVPQLDI